MLTDRSPGRQLPVWARPDVTAQGCLGGWEVHDELESTNSLAAELCADPELRTPYLVLARRQTRGRGRGQHRWHSSAGALTFSWILPWDSPLAEASSLPLVVGLGLRDAIDDWTRPLRCQLKWPNDLYLCDRKLGGILMEVHNQQSQRVVIGIGINCQNSLGQAPLEVQQSAISLGDVGVLASPDEVLAACLQSVWRRITMWTHGKLDVVGQWGPSCWLTGHQVEVALSGQVVRGVCRGIDPTGALLIATGHETVACVSGTVRRLSNGIGLQ